MNKKNIIGRIKRHSSGYDYMSLFPFPSDQILNLEEGIYNKANRAQFLLGELSGITELLPDVNFFISSYVTKDAASSSQIEGTRATMIDAFEFSSNYVIKNDSDADDIFNYIKALNYGIKRITDDNFPFSLRFIREVHKELMCNARSSHFCDPGNFRKSQNWIGGTTPNNATYVPPPPEELHEALDCLEKALHSDFTHPIIQAGLLHAQFETIHPFLDGNGRTGRLIIIFYLMHKKILNRPALFLSSYFKKHQGVYYSRLKEYHAGNVIAWLDFFLDGVIEIAEESILISKRVTNLREQDFIRMSKIRIRNVEINIKVLQKIYSNPIISSNEIVVLSGFTKQGAIAYIKKLVNVGILELYRKGEGSTPSTYIHRKYVSIFL